MADKKMMFCLQCGFSQLAAATDLLCCRCSSPLVLAPQEHVNAFKHLGEYSGAEARRGGECAEDVIDGTVCQSCGCFMQDVLDCAEKEEVWVAPGHPRTCNECGGEF